MFSKVRFLARFVLIGTMVAWAGIGCTKKPNQEEMSKLEQARSAAESAEKKLSELRQERMQLEQSAQTKESELESSEQERDNLKDQ